MCASCPSGTERSVTLQRQKTKIVCTLGPSSSDEATIRRMIQSGMSVARLNFSHGTLDEHARQIGRVRRAAAAENRVIGILIDLPGPKIRLGRLVCEPVELESGNEVVLTTDPSPADPAKIPVDYPPLPTLLGPGNLLYINDGLVQLRVLESGGDEIRAEVLIGGTLTSRKGLNVLDSVLPVDAVTCRDLELIEVGLALGVHTFTISSPRSSSTGSQTSLPSRIFGPGRSIRIPITRFSAAAARRTRPTCRACSSRVPCEKLSRATLIPACIIRRIVASSDDDGPRVQTILVFCRWSVTNRPVPLGRRAGINLPRAATLIDRPGECCWCPPR